MTAIDQQQMLAALMLLVMALLVASGYPPVARWRRFEPPRDCRRPFGLSYAATGVSSSIS